MWLESGFAFFYNMLFIKSQMQRHFPFWKIQWRCRLSKCKFHISNTIKHLPSLSIQIVWEKNGGTNRTRFFPNRQILLSSSSTPGFPCTHQLQLQAASLSHSTAWPIVTCRGKLCSNSIFQYCSAKLDYFQLHNVIYLHFLVAWPRKIGMKKLFSPPIH